MHAAKANFSLGSSHSQLRLPLYVGGPCLTPGLVVLVLAVLRDFFLTPKTRFLCIKGLTVLELTL